METVIHRGQARAEVSAEREEALKICLRGTSWGPVVETYLPVQGLWFDPWSGGKIRMPHSQKNQHMKWKQYCNRLNKRLKNDSCQKKIRD